MKKIVWISLIVVFALLLLGNLFTYTLQEYFIFQPDKLSAEFHFDPGVPYTELFLKAEDGATINALFMMTTDIEPKGCVLYLHGNAGNLQRWSELHSIFTDNGYNVLMPDFRGFGKSTGELNEANFLKDAVMCLEWLQDHCILDKTIIYGRSMGTAAAAYVASIHTPDHLILETPYSSMKKLFFSYYPFMPPLFIFKFNLDTERWLKNLNAPVTIFHGTEDWIIPLDNALQLKQSLKDTDRFIMIEGASHNDIGTFRVYKETIDGILSVK
jgi:uncharacterized protein